jgi:hypothetical protein
VRHVVSWPGPCDCWATDARYFLTEWKSRPARSKNLCISCIAKAVGSSFNQLIEVTLDGELREIVVFPSLDSGQQAVPPGLTVDPRTGEILVALFSGAVVDDETGELILFIPSDAKVVCVDPETASSSTKSPI